MEKWNRGISAEDAKWRKVNCIQTMEKDGGLE